MTITGRVPLVLLLGLVPVVLRPAASTVWLWLLVVTVLVGADLLLAPSPTGLTVARGEIGAIRLGLRPEAELEGVDVAEVLASALSSVPVPR